MASPLRFTLTSIPTPFLFCFLKFLRFALFYVACILIVLALAAISASCRAAEMVLVLHLFTICSFLLALQLEQASTPPITVGRVTGSPPILCRTVVEKIRAPLPLEGGHSFMCFNCPPQPFPGLEWGSGDLPPVCFSTAVSLRRCLRMYLSM